MEGELLLTLNLGPLIEIPLLGTLIYLVLRNHRRLQKIEKLVTPVKTDHKGVRYFPPHEELGIDLDPEVVSELRKKHRETMRDMGHEQPR